MAAVADAFLDGKIATIVNENPNIYVPYKKHIVNIKTLLDSVKISIYKTPTISKEVKKTMQALNINQLL